MINEAETLKSMIDDLNADELLELRNEIDSRIEDAKAEKINQLAEQMKQWGISSTDLNGHAKTHKKLPMKYRNPDNPDEMWSGKGRAPNWVKNYEAYGKSRDDLKIP